jgi:tripeptidyl-peptidase-1
MRYHPLSVFPTVATALLVSLAMPHAPHWSGMRVMHLWSNIPNNWKSIGHPHADATIDLHLALKSQNEDALIDALNEVSNPKHPRYVPSPRFSAHSRVRVPTCSRYGAYLSQEQVAELVASHPDTFELVSSWLEHHRIPSSSISTTLGGNWLKVVSVPVSQANTILSASYQLYNHVERNDTVLRTISYSLPEALHGHIQAVVPTTYFGRSTVMQGSKRQMRPSEAAEARAKEGPPDKLMTGLSSRVDEPAVSPATLRWLYKTIGYVPAAAGRNELGIGGFSHQFPSPQDLHQFMEEYRSDGEDADYTVELVNGGGYDPSDPGQEANFDVQYTEAISYPTPITYYSTAGDLDSDSDPYIHWLAYLINQKTIPQTITTSYGDYEHDTPPDYAFRICYLLVQLGSRGVSVIFSTSDWGVGQGDCTFYDNLGNPHAYFLPVFPASCTCL